MDLAVKETCANVATGLGWKPAEQLDGVAVCQPQITSVFPTSPFQDLRRLSIVVSHYILQETMNHNSA